MIFTPTVIDKAFVIDPEPHCDARGSFARTFCAREFAAHGLRDVMVQSNRSVTRRRHTLRGMHRQRGAAAEAKLVRCVRGEILDVIVDLRPDSATWGRHVKTLLRASDARMVYVPEGCAHGFLTLTDDCEVFYQVSNHYQPELESGVRWNDPALGIDWPVTDPLLSDKDRGYPDLDPARP